MIQTLETPYYAVIFSSLKSSDIEGYDETAQRMQALCEAQSGFLGMVHAVTNEGVSVTTCYWRDLASISAWKAHSEHQAAQQSGIERWYDEYTIEIARIEKTYSWQRTQINPVGEVSGVDANQE